VLLSAGDIDPTFGSNGLAYAPLGALNAADVALSPDGKVVVVASTWGRDFESVAVGRLNANGGIDPSFSPAFPVVIPPDEGGLMDGVWATGLAVQSDRKLLVAGGAYDEGFDTGAMESFSRRAGFIWRLREDGTPDPTFGGGDGVITGPEGIVTIPEAGPWPDGAGPFVGLVVLPDGKIVSARTGSLYRFNPDGTPDTSFGGDGAVGIPMPAGATAFDPYKLAVAGDGSGDVLVLGSVMAPRGGESVQNLVVARVRHDGTLAPSFGGGDGLVVEPVGTGAPFSAMPYALAAAPKGGVVLGGHRGSAAQSRFAVARYTAAGALDAGFARGGDDGDGVASAGTAGEGRGANDVAVLADGGVLAVGNAGSIFSVVRFTADGLVDPSFASGGSDGDGVATIDLPPDEPNPNPDDTRSLVPAHAVAVQPDGKVIAAAGDAFSDGWTSHGNVILARFLADPPAPVGRTYEAEQALITGAAVSRAHPGYTGTGYVDYAHAAGDYAEFTVDAPAAGTYELAFRYANGGTSARRMDLRVTGAAVPGGLSFAPTGSWRTWNSRAVTVSLAAGANKVRLVASGQSGPNVDALTVTPLAPPAVVYQAESATRYGAIASAAQSGYTGTGYVDYAHASGDFVEFAVDAPGSGTYALDFRYANGGTYDRPLDLSVDGAAAGQLTFVPTGSWRTWTSVAKSVLLTAGRHTVRLTATGRSGPNLDSLAVRAGE
jgi:uncharacterized delta-60 repeat protein